MFVWHEIEYEYRCAEYEYDLGEVWHLDHGDHGEHGGGRFD